MTLDVLPSHLKIVRDILIKDLPPRSKVWVFGSRSKKAKKKFSDLDLLIDTNGQKLPLDVSLQLNEDFDESDLPYKVDIVDWNSINESFRSLIENKILLLEV